MWNLTIGQIRKIFQPSQNTHRGAVARPKVNGPPSGYPRFAAFLGSHSSLHIFRRFTALRLRLMLCKQDQLSVLEQQLQEIDRSESKPLYLGSLRRDQNPERKRILDEIDTLLSEYDALAERNEHAFARCEARGRDMANVRNWLADNGSIARKETEYIDTAEDTMTLEKDASDIALNAVAVSAEQLLMRLPRAWTSKLRTSNPREPKLWVFPNALLHGFGRVVLACVLVTLLFVPIVTISAIESLRARVVLIWISATLFILVLTVLTRAKTSEIFVAGTTYATVLVVFLAQNEN
ncbi:hypothetical protein BU26DRAFT_522480 [Trematosphaeria pertusa]|uniref:DUF6594 domain-containing protein n=1 Tax=Trematosphaeria pertusa TaxID=390896 RepID=A0A6A6I547_9PLEO|nr:uncharacterized protein BU26DRAFT_522480 [Trematosphaeria pertusa]KAF2244683.1 hypothetical protein BU26DRAFT_522480 [Trematosphaeria pertusa]